MSVSTNATLAPAWIAVDWGSSNLRAWALDADDRVIAEASAPRGMLGLAPEAFEGALLEVIGDWLAPAAGSRPTEVLVCGMAGARQGWVEAAYLPLDAGATDTLGRLGGRLTPVTTRDARLRVRIVPGLCQHASQDGGEAFDVMRGEETQLFGLVARHPEFSGAVCLPGTHAKWARLEAGRITGFTTFMSGELYQLLSRDSVLKHSLHADDLADAAQHAAYLEGIDIAMATPERLSAELFGIRARDLLDPRLPVGERRGARLGARLSGLVLGLELAGATVTLAPGSRVVLIGAETLCHRYRIALEHRGFTVDEHANADMILAGLGRIHHTTLATP
ncbi:2-dehydro-3-deoxygalactonokinase [Halomonas nitroreducens]|uniref:2-dehydro-3-deoxygalactonokinase n=1 Tax=Halomonas nitroreducens TaxID=447425 RepID=A0A3S0JX67_9GAMM|nr:2-dehydro-3-deoxygalactonokinase [Halomonas nitroreducens]RTR02883.1 2-dehydro-3-deoxygalactonokinase [Halomonas nitroreducens]